MQPLVSIILPNYNSAKFILECLNSISLQTYKNWELIIIDDGSTDLSSQMILDYLKSMKTECKLIIKSHIGLPSCLNLGIELAKGKYIARIDADDIMVISRLEKQVAFLEGNPTIGICGSNAIEIEECGKTISMIEMPETHIEIKEKLTSMNPIIHPSVMIRKELFNLIKYNNDYPSPEDYELWTKLESKTKFHNLQEPLIKKRYHSSQVTLQINKRFIYKTFKIRIIYALKKKKYLDALKSLLGIISTLIPKFLILKFIKNRRKSLARRTQS